MPNSTQYTTFQRKLIDLSESASGFAASELTGFSPEIVRRAAEALVKTGEIVRLKVSPRRVRYFATAELGKAYVTGAAVATAATRRQTSTLRAKAPWSVDEPGIITAKTKIIIAPPLPRNVYRTYTYPKF
jgi:hypothetical protein